MRPVLLSLGLCVLLIATGCGDDDSSSSTSPTSSTIGGVATLSGLQAQLASVVLQQADVPDGLEGSAPVFSTNAEVAGADQDTLAKLTQQGRQLGVDVQFV